MRDESTHTGAKRLLGIVGVGLLSACTPLHLLNAVVLSHPYHRVRNVAYGPHKREKLDIYIPKTPSAGPVKVVVFFYGGYWRYGRKRGYKFVGEALSSRGVIAVVPNYRLYPSVDWHGFVADGALAYRWVERHIKAYGGDSRQVFVMGHSAGAYIAAMVAFDHPLQKAMKLTSPPCGFIGLAGPYAFLPITNPKVQQVFASSRHLIDTQPIHYVSSGDPPTLLLFGRDDHTVNPSNSLRLAAALKAHGDRVRVISYPDIGHISLLVSLASPFRFLAPTLRDTMAFVQSTTCRPPSAFAKRAPKPRAPGA